MVGGLGKGLKTQETSTFNVYYKQQNGVSIRTTHKQTLDPSA